MTSPLAIASLIRILPDSADTLVDQGANGQAVPYYRAQVRIDPAAPGAKLAGVEPSPA